MPQGAFSMERVVFPVLAEEGERQDSYSRVIL